MFELNDNLYNRTVNRNDPKLKIWSSAGLMLTYQCTARCRFCYYHCSPENTGLMSHAMALAAWQSLKNLAGESAKIHITGGEPFLFWPNLKQILTSASNAGLGPADMVETNASWAHEESIITDRLQFLNTHIRRLKISWDPFHAEYVSYENVRLLARLAEQILGPDRVLVRWREYLDQPPPADISDSERHSLDRLTCQAHPIRFTGRAAMELGDLFADKSAESLTGLTCAKSFLAAKGVHIDPFGNVFSGVCSGIIIGNIQISPLEEIWRNFHHNNNELLCVLFNKGPVGLLEKAIQSGYKKRRLYAGKCHLCTDLRQFFFDKGFFRQIIGPGRCYARKKGTLSE